MNSPKRLFILLAGLCLLLSQSVLYSSSVSLSYSAYPDKQNHVTRAPAGYKPFYISTFSRHGSRYLRSTSEYNEPLRILEEASRGGYLTETGKLLLEDLRAIAEDAKGKYGTLLPRGGREHRHIMERTVASYPSIFSGKNCLIDVYSSQSNRCMMSMTYSLDAISAKNPFVRYERHAGDKVQSEVFGTYHMSTVASNYLRDYFGKDDDSYANEAILDKIFTYNEAQKARYLTPKDRKQLPYYLWALSCSTALNDELGVDLFKYFTEEDFQKITEEKNRREYIAMGPSEEYGELALDQAAGTLRGIIEKADEALAGGPYSGTLRYGHDSQLTPLTSLMLIEGCCTTAEDPSHPESVWRIGEICPMAANIQMIFFRKKGSDDVLVKVLLNENEKRLVGVETDKWPFYHWSDLRKAYVDRMNSIPSYNRGGWQNDTIQEGFVYRRYSGVEPVSRAHQIIQLVDVDLNNPRYEVKFSYNENRSSTSDAFNDAGAIASINATYERESVFIRVDGKTIHNIESDIVPFLGAVPQWKTDSSISTDGKEVKIEYTGKGLTIPEQREAYEAIEYPNVFTSAPMLIEDYVPVGKYFAASNLTDREIEALSYEDPLRHQSVRHPRTAVALTEDNHLILIVVDGRRPGFAEGMNAFELTSFIEDQFHPKDAINLDGGGSTALCVKGRGEPSTHVVNYPSKSRTFKHDMERSVPTHIHIIDNQKDK